MTELIKDKLYAIVVPVWQSIKSKGGKEITFNGEYGSITKKYKFDFKILGTVTKDTIDFDCEPYVEKYFDTITGLEYFKVYNEEIKGSTCKKEAFNSLIESSELLFTNPINPPVFIEYKYTYAEWKKMNREWQQAENNLIQKLLIIEKI